jgi:hypothetical protein
MPTFWPVISTIKPVRRRKITMDCFMPYYSDFIEITGIPEVFQILTESYGVIFEYPVA